MIKLPEPFRKQGQQLCNDGNTTVFFDAYNKDQLKQAVRDAYEDAAKACDRLRREQIRYFNSMGSAGCPEYGPSDCAERICALIKEIE